MTSYFMHPLDGSQTLLKASDLFITLKKKFNKAGADEQYEENISRIFVPYIGCVKFWGRK